MVTASGLCTVLGGALVFCVKATNHRFLSASLGLAAGVMVVRATGKSLRGSRSSPTPAHARARAHV